jgi:HEAT repeat protein
MSTNSDGTLNSGPEGRKPVRRLQTNVRALIALVACCGAILWAWRNVSQNNDPVRAEVRSIQNRAIGALQSGKPADRLAAIVELERLWSADSSIAIAPLIAAIDDPETSVRLAAIEALDSIGRVMAKAGTGGEAMRTSATALTRYLNDPDQAVRFAAFKALGSIGPNAVKLGAGGDAVRTWATALVGCMKGPGPAVRVAAVNALGLIGSSVVKSGSDGETVRASATALLECVKDPEPSVRSAAAISLGEITPPRSDLTATPAIDRATVMDALVELLGDRDAEVRRAAINAIASHPSGSDPPKLLAEGFKDELAQNRAEAVSCLGVYRQGLDSWAPILIQLAERDPDRSVRQQCFDTLAHAFKRPAVTVAVVPVLAAGLRSKDAGVRSQLASVLSGFTADGREAIPDLLRVLREWLDAHRGPNRGDDDPAHSAAIALGRIAPGSAEAKEVIAALIELARFSPEGGVGWAPAAAADALGEFGPAAVESVPVLIKFLNDAGANDKFNERHATVATAIGKIAPETPAAEQAVAALLAVLKSKEWQSRRAAVNALSQFGPRAAAAIPGLRALKDDHDYDVKTAAAKALLAIEDESGP